ncbi:MAG: phosphoenolpyruvate mutase [Lachnospiraceae bacterium]|nr:phosphoenolpyruvate mutase [Lachnospiraceae bacterium]
MAKTVYLTTSTDTIHGGHINIIKKAAELGELTVGVLADEAVAGYKRYPLLCYEERAALFAGLKGVARVVRQESHGYRDCLLKYRPDILVHGDDWLEGNLKPLRDEAIFVLDSYGGKLVEFPYTRKEQYDLIENIRESQASIPDVRRGRLKKLLELKPLVTAMEAHNGLTGLIVEKAKHFEAGGTRQFDAMWVSSLCDSTAKGKPDIELVDLSSRVRTIDEIMEVTTKPIIVDGDTGGLLEHFSYTVRTLERMGVSAVIIEDKTGLKRNSLLGDEVLQTQCDIPSFCDKISAGKASLKTKDFMVIARIESFILGKGQEDALARAAAFVEAGADGIMIHSRQKTPGEVFGFAEKFRENNKITPLVIVPSSFSTVSEPDCLGKGINIVIYANQLIRSAFPAMMGTAQSILKHQRAFEAEGDLMSINEIITLIPER